MYLPQTEYSLSVMQFQIFATVLTYLWQRNSNESNERRLSLMNVNMPVLPVRGAGIGLVIDRSDAGRVGSSMQCGEHLSS